jgi:hypothetical protein
MTIATIRMPRKSLAQLLHDAAEQRERTVAAEEETARRVIADWPGLKDAQLYQGRDLKPTTDLRAVAKGVLAGLYGVSPVVLAERVSPAAAEPRQCKALLLKQKNSYSTSEKNRPIK